jgi:two-component system OmpR family response regulator
MLATSGPTPGDTLSLGALHIDLEAYTARLNGVRLDLTSTQIELLAMLIQNQRRVMSRAELAKGLRLRQGRSVDVLLSILRQKIGHSIVRNVRGRGWILDADALSHHTA